MHSGKYRQKVAAVTATRESIYVCDIFIFNSEKKIELHIRCDDVQEQYCTVIHSCKKKKTIDLKFTVSIFICGGML